LCQIETRDSDRISGKVSKKT